MRFTDPGIDQVLIGGRRMCVTFHQPFNIMTTFYQQAQCDKNQHTNNTKISIKLKMFEMHASHGD